MNRNEMEAKAVKALEDRIEIVYEVHSHDNQVDVIGTIGGDAVHYRVYFDGDEVKSIGCK